VREDDNIEKKGVHLRPGKRPRWWAGLEKEVAGSARGRGEKMGWREMQPRGLAGLGFLFLKLFSLFVSKLIL
jgi:hypothetical protein